MAAGFPVSVAGLGMRTVEALYQACRYPYRPDLQREIIEQRSPMAAKMVSRTHADSTRHDWSQVRVRIMRWCLRVKLAHNYERFGQLLLATDDHPIVEESRRDAFWGAVPVGPDELVGMNVLGRLLMDLRHDARSGADGEQADVEPPDVPDFRFDGDEIGRLGETDARRAAEMWPESEVPKPQQGTLFD